MIDFKNASFIKLKPVSDNDFAGMITPMFAPGEQIIQSFSGIRDGVVFTNKRIIIRSGIIGIDFKNIYYTEIESVNLKVGLVDKMLGVGDIYIKSNNKAQILFDIEDPYFITQKLQEIVIDIKTDVEFPNGLRPEENPGYKTKYTKYTDSIDSKNTK